MSKNFDVQITNKFKKQYAKVSKQQNFKREEFIKVVKLLSDNKLLPAKYNNHLLSPKANRYMGMSYSTRYFIRIPKER